MANCLLKTYLPLQHSMKKDFSLLGIGEYCLINQGYPGQYEDLDVTSYN